jgi:1-deoxy-D-xylulose-5-phosphate reductoisomerase
VADPGGRRGVTLLGATGSVGGSTLDVLRCHADRFRLVAVAGGSRASELAAVVREFRPELAALATEHAVTPELREACAAAGTRLTAGADAVRDAGAHPSGDVVVAAIVGAAGLPATAAAVERGAILALANKESLVVAGQALTTIAARTGARLLPVDSEHAAIHQCLRSGAREEVRRLVLTASGGPFRDRPAGTFGDITVEQALAHPTWRMGSKISIDSATLMNKGLEVIEARWLFGFGEESIDVVIHPQSIVHSLVEFRDGSVIAQLSRPDMRDPVRYCLGWPERLDAPVAPLDLAAVSPLTFEPPDTTRFPCLSLARQALRAGGAAPAVLNAANEVAVAAFLDRRLAFTAIPELIDETLQRLPSLPAGDLEQALAADAEARRVGADLLAARA